MYEFMRNALLGSFMISVVAGIIGTIIVCRRKVFVAGGITHASFGGIGIAYYLGLNPIVGAFIFAVATALGIDVLERKGTIRGDSAIAMLWSLGMAIGLIFMFLTPSYASNLMGFMFGDILSISTIDLWCIAVVATLSLLLSVLFYRPLLYVSFSPSFARVVGLRVGLIETIISIVTAIGIVVAIKAVGIVLVLSIFTIPQAIVGKWKRQMGWMMLWSGVIAFVGALLGLAASYYLDWPAGAVITAVLALLKLLLP
ncbi:MAG: metal ABC transporter permease [Marinilabiliaceae bacterium]|nr:metal ABC transporter permease [Marinilabiliaceae bacterium]